MTSLSAPRLALALALAAGLAGCNLLKKQDQDYAPPPGTKVVPVVAERDMPTDGTGKPVDSGDGPVLQVLGSLEGVELGPRNGACTFQHKDGRELLVTAAPTKSDSIAVGAVRSGGVIVMLQSRDKIGADGLRAGPTLSGGKLTITVARADGNGEIVGNMRRWNANLGVRDISGKQRIYSPGTWLCK